MSNATGLIADKALSLVGCGYIYGATGWTCTQARLDQQAAQYPEYADAIRKHGPKWIGKPCYDCAQLTKVAAKAAGVKIPSGATSQWKADVWAEKGTIDTLPRSEPGIFLYRESGGKMQHTGVSLGDGTFVDSRGHAYGVLRTALEKYAWTHWARLRVAVTLPASPAGESDEVIMVDAGVVDDAAPTDRLAVVVADNGKPARLRADPSTKKPWIAEVPVGTLVTVHATGDSGGEQWATVTVQWSGKRGYMMARFLQITG